ncbi:MAG: hypothetical protein ACI86H_002804 [bacterium]|jgi:hypothetical protein
MTWLETVLGFSITVSHCIEGIIKSLGKHFTCSNFRSTSPNLRRGKSILLGKMFLLKHFKISQKELLLDIPSFSARKT